MNKVKKILVVFMSVLFVFALSVAFASCGETETEAYKITLDYDESQGAVTLEPDAETYAPNTEVTVSVSAKESFVVDSVKVDGEKVTLKEGKYQLTVTKDMTVSASFYPEGGYHVTLADYDEEKGTVSLSPVQEGYLPGTTVTVNAEPAEGYEVDQVTVNGNAISKVSGKYTFTVEGDSTVAVTFKEIKKDETYSVTFDFDSSMGRLELWDPEVPEVVNEFKAGDTVQIFASAELGYEIESVTANGNPIEHDAEDVNIYSFVIEGNTTVKATFKPVEDVALVLPEAYQGTYHVYTPEEEDPGGDEGGLLALSEDDVPDIVADATHTMWGDQEIRLISEDYSRVVKIDGTLYNLDLNEAEGTIYLYAFDFSVEHYFKLEGFVAPTSWTVTVNYGNENHDAMGSVRVVDAETGLPSEDDSYPVDATIYVYVECMPGYEVELINADASTLDWYYDAELDRYEFTLTHNTVITVTFKTAAVEEGLHITVDVDPEKGYVTDIDTTKAYTDGETVTFHAEALAGWEVDQVTANDEPLSLVSNTLSQYSFTIHEDTVIKVTFKEASKTSFVAEEAYRGTYTYAGDDGAELDDIVVGETNAMFGEKEIFLIEHNYGLNYTVSIDGATYTLAFEEGGLTLFDATGASYYFAKQDYVEPTSFTVTVSYADDEYTEAMGTVTVTDAKGSAHENNVYDANSTVYVTVNPGAGYRLAHIYLAGQEDNSLVWDAASGRYSFTLKGDTTVVVSFEAFTTTALVLDETYQGVYTCDGQQNIVADAEKTMWGENEIRLISVVSSPAEGNVYEADVLVGNAQYTLSVDSDGALHLVDGENDLVFTLMPPAPSTYTVTVNYDDSKGEVVLIIGGMPADVAPSYTVTANSQIYITVTANPGYTASVEIVGEAGDFKKDGSDWSYTVTRDTVFNVTFEGGTVGGNTFILPAEYQGTYLYNGMESVAETIVADATHTMWGDNEIFFVLPGSPSGDDVYAASVTCNGVSYNLAINNSNVLRLQDTSTFSLYFFNKQAEGPSDELTVEFETYTEGLLSFPPEFLGFSSGPFKSGDTVTFRVQPYQGYTVTGATANGQPCTPQGEYDNFFTFVITEDTKVEATFASAVLEPLVLPAEYQGTYHYEDGGYPDIVADADKTMYGEYQVYLVDHSDGSTYYSVKYNDETHSFSFESSAVLVDMNYYFRKQAVATNTYTVEVQYADDYTSEMGTATIVDPKDSYTMGDVVQIRVTPGAGYEIELVTVNGEQVTADSGSLDTYTVTVNDVDIVVVVSFKEASPEFNIQSAWEGTWKTLDGTKTFNFTNTTATLTEGEGDPVSASSCTSTMSALQLGFNGQTYNFADISLDEANFHFSDAIYFAHLTIGDAEPVWVMKDVEKKDIDSKYYGTWYNGEGKGVLDISAEEGVKWDGVAVQAVVYVESCTTLGGDDFTDGYYILHEDRAYYLNWYTDSTFAGQEYGRVYDNPVVDGLNWFNEIYVDALLEGTWKTNDGSATVTVDTQAGTVKINDSDVPVYNKSGTKGGGNLVEWNGKLYHLTTDTGNPEVYGWLEEKVDVGSGPRTYLLKDGVDNNQVVTTTGLPNTVWEHKNAETQLTDTLAISEDGHVTYNGNAAYIWHITPPGEAILKVTFYCEGKIMYFTYTSGDSKIDVSDGVTVVAYEKHVEGGEEVGTGFLGFKLKTYNEVYGGRVIVAADSITVNDDNLGLSNVVITMDDLTEAELPSDFGTSLGKTYSFTAMNSNSEMEKTYYLDLNDSGDFTIYMSTYTYSEYKA